MIKKAITLIYFFVIISHVAFGQIQDVNNFNYLDSSYLEEVLVTAQRIEGRSFDQAESLMKINHRQLNMLQTRTVPDGLASLGIWTQKTNYGGGSPFLGGLTGNQILTLFDGLRLNNSTFRYGPNQYLNTLDVFSINSIEVLKFGGAVMYGSDALGGTIQVNSKKLEYSQRRKYEVSWLNRFSMPTSELTTHGEIGISNPRIAFIGGISARNFGDIYGGKNTGLQNPTGYSESSYHVKTKYRLSSYSNFTFLHQALRQRHVPIYHKIVLENYAKYHIESQEKAISYVQWDFSHPGKRFNTFRINLGHQYNLEYRKIQKQDSDYLIEEKDRINTYSVYALMKTSVLPNYNIISGVDVYYDWVNSFRSVFNQNSMDIQQQRGLYPNESSYLNYSIYQQHIMDYKKFQMMLGGRWNGFRGSMQDINLGEIKVLPSAFVYDASLNYLVSRSFRTFISFHTGYRAPNIDDMGTLGIVDFRYEIPNYDLKPEQSRNLAVGVKWAKTKWRVEIVGYRNSLSQLITRVKTNQQIQSYPVYLKTNSEKAYILGAESRVSFRMNTQINCSAYINYSFGENQTRNEPLRRIPPMNLGAFLNYNFQAYNFGVEIHAAGDQYRLAQGDKDDNRIGPKGTEGFMMTNLHAGWRKDQIEIFTEIKNVFNKDYRIHGSGINGIGRNLSCTFIYKY
ncbi:MAG: TonB-dependent receptor [Saprospiraceae bacterium]|nr:TonB-dependent receptor [Candidatus Vicinibacter affinis]